MPESNRLSINAENGQTWQLCTTKFFYCPAHGKCPAVLERADPYGEEIVKSFGTTRFFFCEQCKMVKIINVWNNCNGLTGAKIDDASRGPITECKQCKKTKHVNNRGWCEECEDYLDGAMRYG